MRILIIGLLLILGLYACGDQEVADIEIPDAVELGKTEVYLNGEPYKIYTEFYHDTINEQLLFGFRQGDQSLLTSLGFSFLPVSEGNYIVHTERELYLGAKTSFRQTVNSEFDGWVYGLINAEDGFFDISRLDQNNCTVEGKFKVEFELDLKNGFGNTGLPKKVKFQGVFHEVYIKG